MIYKTIITYRTDVTERGCIFNIQEKTTYFLGIKVCYKERTLEKYY